MGIERKIGLPRIPRLGSQQLPQNLVQRCRGMIFKDPFEALGTPATSRAVDRIRVRLYPPVGRQRL